MDTSLNILQTAKRCQQQDRGTLAQRVITSSISILSPGFTSCSRCTIWMFCFQRPSSGPMDPAASAIIYMYVNIHLYIRSGTLLWETVIFLLFVHNTWYATGGNCVQGTPKKIAENCGRLQTATPPPVRKQLTLQTTTTKKPWSGQGKFRVLTLFYTIFFLVFLSNTQNAIYVYLR
jgi:hypothetical protein